MIEYKLLKKNGLTPKKIIKKNNTYILETIDNKKYVLKENKNDLEQKLNYLKSRNFLYFPNFSKLDNYNVFEYIENSNISDEEKLYDIIDLISLLHTKTTRYRNIDLDDYKITYENLLDKIDYLTKYYNELNNLIDNEIYMSPSNYLLARNISKIYKSLYFARNELDNWYDLVKDNPKQRVSFIHNNLDLDHLVRNNSPYLISWDNSIVDSPINDLYNLYIKYYKETNFDILLGEYQKRFPLREDEKKLLLIKISIPFKIEFKNDEYNNTLLVRDLLVYVSRTEKLIKSFYKKV